MVSPLIDPAPDDPLDAPSHAGQHVAQNDALRDLDAGLAAHEALPHGGSGGTSDHALLTNVTPNQHHNRAHALSSAADHTVSTVAGLIFQATSATAAAFGALTDAQIPGTITRDTELASSLATHAATPHTGGDHAALTNVLPDQHHNKSHAMQAGPGLDHTMTSTAGWVYQATGTNTAGFAPHPHVPVVFPATAVPSTDVNTLDDYQEGTFTPTLSAQTPGDLAVTYTTQLGRYVKVGRLVTWWIRMLPATFTYTTAAGYLRLIALPFTPMSAPGMVWLGSAQFRYVKAGWSGPSSYVAPSDGGVYFLLGQSGTQPTLVNITDLTTAVPSQIYASGAYETDS